MKIWKENGMEISIKDKKELDDMRHGGKILGSILSELQKIAKAGITTLELNEVAENMMLEANVIPSFKGYQGFPAVICSCVNDEVVHGIPNSRPLENGDLLTIDCGVIHNGLHTDSAVCFVIGDAEGNEEKQKFIDTAYKALEKAIEAAKPGVRVGKISGIIQDIVEKKGYAVSRELVGHGIGYDLHEDPNVPNFRDHDVGPILQIGMTLAIEPIIMMGSWKTRTLSDGWTVVTKDKSLAAQVEHTIAITAKGAEILTKRYS